MSSYHSQEQTLAQLPEPSALEIKHSSELIELIVSEIERQGVISFHDYMNRVLYEPGLGYYSAGTTKFGAAGDFITAPELSPLFGRCLAQQFESIFSQGCARQLLEFGAGSGRLCEQILSSLTEATPYSIVEVSADLKARQQQYLQDKLSPTVFKNIKWLDALPENFEGIMFGNEVLDAMPVNVVLKDGQWQELGVGFEEGRFVWMPYVNRNDISSNDLAQIDAIKTIQKIEADLIKAGFGAFPEGYCTEINLNYRPWLEALHSSCHQAVILMIDYGYEQAQYYHPDRSSGTLTCYYRHRTHPDPFVYPGLQDITAFVDFDAFAGAAIDAGFTVRGLTNQRQFLLQNGLLEAAQELSEVGDTQVQIEVAQQVKTLILPGEMGDKFLVVGLQKNDLQNGLSIEIPALTSER
ncbi:MAG: SAM-dependent MidA family methyltransferase [Gammaproteobacteria bacterium]|jgi:SAM-dependent MidA family methyltransferase